MQKWDKNVKIKRTQIWFSKENLIKTVGRDKPMWRKDKTVSQRECG